MLSKNVNNKKCAPKLIFFNEKKKIEKDLDNFWSRKLTLKVKRLGDFALFDTSTLTQFSIFNNFLWVCWFLGKNLSTFVSPNLKLHNLYCHKAYWFNTRTITTISMVARIQNKAARRTAAARTVHFSCSASVSHWVVSFRWWKLFRCIITTYEEYIYNTIKIREQIQHIVNYIYICWYIQDQNVFGNRNQRDTNPGTQKTYSFKNKKQKKSVPSLPISLPTKLREDVNILIII